MSTNHPSNIPSNAKMKVLGSGSPGVNSSSKQGWVRALRLRLDGVSPTISSLGGGVLRSFLVSAACSRVDLKVNH